jgi:hypothetical protein
MRLKAALVVLLVAGCGGSGGSRESSSPTSSSRRRARSRSTGTETLAARLPLRGRERRARADAARRAPPDRHARDDGRAARPPRQTGSTVTYPIEGEIRFVQSETHRHWHFSISSATTCSRRLGETSAATKKTGFCPRRPLRTREEHRASRRAGPTCLDTGVRARRAGAPDRPRGQSPLATETTTSRAWRASRRHHQTFLRASTSSATA